jgi:hypoxanthine phosphoribosyltransferase
MKVVTLDDARFGAACLDLWTAATAGKAPDFLVGIRTGGYVVADRMIREARPAATTLLPITRRRSTTAAKNASPLVGKVLRALPYLVTDKIRVVEHHILTAKHEKATPGAPPKEWSPDPAEGAALTEAIRARPGASVLIVDDAVDTGATLLAVKRFVEATDPSATVRSAVLVTTTAEPIARADVSLHTNVLLRFPWSNDFVA